MDSHFQKHAELIEKENKKTYEFMKSLKPELPSIKISAPIKPIMIVAGTRKPRGDGKCSLGIRARAFRDLPNNNQTSISTDPVKNRHCGLGCARTEEQIKSEQKKIKYIQTQEQVKVLNTAFLNLRSPQIRTGEPRKTRVSDIPSSTPAILNLDKSVRYDDISSVLPNTGLKTSTITSDQFEETPHVENKAPGSNLQTSTNLDTSFSKAKNLDTSFLKATPVTPNKSLDIKQGIKRIAECGPETNAKFLKPQNQKSCDLSATISDPLEFIKKVEQNITTREVTELEEVDEVFIDGALHFVNYLENKQSDVEEIPVVKTKPVEHVFLKTRRGSEHLSLPARKDTLPKRRADYSDPFISNLYLRDNTNVALNTETKWVLRKGFLKKYNIEIGSRLVVVQWMLEIQLQYQMEDILFHSAVKIFDYMLAVGNYTKKDFLLVSICSLWIVDKFYNGINATLRVSKIFKLCKEKNSRCEILQMERYILRSINFEIQSPNCILFGTYFTCLLTVPPKANMALIRDASSFICDCATYFPIYSSMLPSMLSASALYLTYKFFNEEMEPLINRLKPVYDEGTIRAHALSLLEKVKFVIKHRDFYGVPYNKYNVAHRGYASRHFNSILAFSIDFI